MKTDFLLPKILMIGTDPDSRGGISSVIRMYLEGGLFDHRVMFLASFTDGNKFQKTTYYLRFLIQFIRVLIMQPSIRVVHVHTASYGSFLRKSLIILLSRLTGRQVILHVHGAEFHLFYKKMPALIQQIIRHLLQSCTVLIALSSQWKNELQAIAENSDIRVIYNPTILPASDRTYNHAENETVNFLFMGRLGKRKGVYDIIEAAKRLHMPNVKIQLYGDGEIDDVRCRILSAGVEERVTVCGWIDGRMKEETFRKANVLLLPSYNEGLPVSILEALAYGIPVVATRVGGIPEAVEDGLNGYLIPPGDCDRLAESIERLARSPELRFRMGQHGYDSAVQKFALSVIIEKMEALYNELVQESV